jgi:hypothetical protein
LAGIYTRVDDAGAIFPELRGVNPHYVEGAGLGVNTNCVSCVIAADARLTGRIPNAIAARTGYSRSLNDLLPAAPYGFGPEINVAQATATLLARGERATTPLVIIQPHSQHTINGVVRNGKVIWVDTQMNKIVTLNPNVTVRLGNPR